MNDPFLNIHSHAHAMLVEQIMALIGRSSRDPKRYRRLLESQDGATLRRTLEQLTSDDLESEAPMQRAGESPAQLPATELTTACDEPRRIQSEPSDGSARDFSHPSPQPSHLPA